MGRDLDVVGIARGLAIPGGDLRHWLSYATVAAVDDDGDVDLSNPNAVVITPAGIEVDVVLEPSKYPVTCRHGIAAGRVFVCGPIEVGDQVVVGIPDGDVSMVPQVLAVISGPNGARDAVPVDGGGVPLFHNDRFMVCARGVPIDLRTTGGSQVLVNPDGSVVINAGSKGAARKDDSVQVTLSGTSPAPGSILDLAARLLGTGLFTPNPSPPPPPPQADFTATGAITGGSQTVKVGG